jgi:hypothetical protein
MSDSGLYMHLYSELRDCAELVDRVIIDLESGSGSAATEDRRHLSQLLRALQKAPASTLSTTLLANVLRESRAAATVKWDEVADAVERGDSAKPTMQRLEDLARALESERAEMHARVHGSHAR